MLKFQAAAEKTAKNFRGLLFLPHPVVLILLMVFWPKSAKAILLQQISHEFRLCLLHRVSCYTCIMK